jgi:hypothetical protein
MRSIVLLLVFTANLTLLAPERACGAENETPADAPVGKDQTASTFESSRASRFYGGVEYLRWWVKGAPLSVPLVSSGSTAFKEGFLVNSSATILYGAPYSPASGGNDTQDFPAFSGGRLTIGFWLDNAQKLALEAGGFVLVRESAGFSARGDARGNYPAGNSSSGMRVPVYSNIAYAPGGATDPETGLALVPVGEDGVPLSLPGDLTGGVTIRNTLQFWGAAATGVINLYRSDSWAISGLAGFSYVDLSESFNLTADIEGLSPSDYQGQSGVASDTFQTWNQFYGGNFGLRARFLRGPLSVELSGSVAAGLNHETQNVSGYYTAVNSPFGSSGPEGIFAQPANEGRTSSDRFAYVPEVQFKLGYAITPSLRATIGYDIIYESNVIRPGDQINRNLPKGQTFQQDGTSPSTTSPSRLFKTTDFFAQGISVGLEYTF